MRDQPEPGRRIVGEQQLRQLVADPLGADDLQPLAHLLDRVHEIRVGLEAERRDEPRRAQHAQRVVAERDLGRERRAQPPGREIGEAVVRVDELGLVERDRDGVDREVAPRQIGG